MNTFFDFINTSASYIGPFFILLGLLIFVHELGHFLVAKFFGVRVEVFSLGFGKKILQYQKGDTNYCVSIIPLGGYVKMYGDDPTAEVPEANKNQAFLLKPVYQRIAIVLAGPLMNLFFAGLVFTIIAMLGEKAPAPVLGDIKTESVAYKAGLRSGMKILGINGLNLQTWDEVAQIVKNNPMEEVTFEVVESTTQNPNVNSSSNETKFIKVRTTLGENDNLLSNQRQVGKIDGLTSLSMGPTVGILDSQSPAGKAGMSPVEIIKQINGNKISYYRDLEDLFKNETFLNTVLEAKKIKIISQSAIGSETPEESSDKNDKTYEIDLSSWNGDLQNLFSTIGFESSELYLYQVKAKSPAFTAGLLPGDKLSKINDVVISQWETIVDAVKNYDNSGNPLKLEVSRRGEPIIVSVVPKMTELMKASGAEDNRFTIGIVPAVFTAIADPVFVQYKNPILALQKGAEQSWVWSKMVAMSFIRMIQNEVSAKNIGGVISIGKYAGQSYQVGLTSFLKLMAIISINLFLINLLPVPILDGGHLLFFTIEAIRGAPLSMRKMEIAQQVGLIILMSLMVFALFNDISNLINPPW